VVDVSALLLHAKIRLLIMNNETSLFIGMLLLIHAIILPMLPLQTLRRYHLKSV
jgi:hypothetical protein